MWLPQQLFGGWWLRTFASCHGSLGLCQNPWNFRLWDLALICPLLNARTMFRSLFATKLHKIFLWTKCFALWKELFHIATWHYKNLATVSHIYINKLLELSFKTTWVPNEYYMLVVTFVCVWAMYNPPNSPEMGTFIFHYPPLAILSCILSTNRSEYRILQPPLFDKHLC